MSFKGDIQATRFNAATSNVIIAPAVRLRGIIIAGAATSGTVVLKTTSATGATLFQGDVPAGDIINFSKKDILMARGVIKKTKKK
jgi:hypothetical protein